MTIAALLLYNKIISPSNLFFLNCHENEASRLLQNVSKNYQAMQHVLQKTAIFIFPSATQIFSESCHSLLILRSQCGQMSLVFNNVMTYSRNYKCAINQPLGCREKELYFIFLAVFHAVHSLVLYGVECWIRLIFHN